MKNHRLIPGFTLLEVLLAVSLVVVLSGAMFYIYSDALKARDSVNEELEFLMVERRVMNMMTSELVSAMEYPFLQTGLEGEAASAEWITIGLPGRGAWALDEREEIQVPPECDVRMVGYRLRMVENEEGQQVPAGLERTCRKILSAVTAEEETEETGEEDIAEIEVRLLTNRIRYINLRYYDGSGWFDTWTEKDLPAAVEITLGDEPMEEEQTEEDYRGNLFRRVVHLPGGRRARAGANVRMGAGS